MSKTLNVKTMNKIKLAVILISLLMTTLLSCSLSHNKYQFSFDSSSCERFDENPYEFSNYGVSTVQWTTPNTLKIEAFVKLNCAFKITKCNIDIKDDILNIEYLARNPDDGFRLLFFKRSIAVCDCINSLSLEIKNLEQKKYKINLVRLKK